MALRVSRGHCCCVEAWNCRKCCQRCRIGDIVSYETLFSLLRRSHGQWCDIQAETTGWQNSCYPWLQHLTEIWIYHSCRRYPKVRPRSSTVLHLQISMSPMKCPWIDCRLCRYSMDPKRSNLYLPLSMLLNNNPRIHFAAASVPKSQLLLPQSRPSLKYQV